MPSRCGLIGGDPRPAGRGLRRTGLRAGAPERYAIGEFKMGNSGKREPTMGNLKILSASLVASAFMASAGAAQDTKTFDNIERVEITNFIGAVSITTGGDTVIVRKSDGTDADYPFHWDADSGALTLGSDENPDDTRWHKEVNWRRDKDKAFARFLQTYPSLEITVPRGTALAFDSAVIRLVADDTDGALNIREGYVDGEIGDIAEGDIALHGSGDLTVGDVAGALDVKIHGSGDFKAGAAAALSAAIHGSGDVETGNIASAVAASIHGSGDVTVGDIRGAVTISVHGSGDVKAAHVDGGADLSTNGSGDLTLASVRGKTDVRIAGSGDVDIAGGWAEELRVRINGSGSFEMAGSASNPDIGVHGSGSAYVAAHDGPVRVSGRGDIKVSGIDYSDNE